MLYDVIVCLKFLLTSTHITHKIHLDAQVILRPNRRWSEHTMCWTHLQNMYAICQKYYGFKIYVIFGFFFQLNILFCFHNCYCTLLVVSFSKRPKIYLFLNKFCFSCTVLKYIVWSIVKCKHFGVRFFYSCENGHKI